MRGYRNCTWCTRWRPISDFRPAKWGNGYIRYIASDCNSCHKLRGREEWARTNRRRKRELAERSREAHAIERRKAGIPYRPPGPANKGKYGAGRVKVIDQREYKRLYRERHK